MVADFERIARLFDRRRRRQFAGGQRAAERMGAFALDLRRRRLLAQAPSAAATARAGQRQEDESGRLVGHHFVGRGVGAKRPAEAGDDGDRQRREPVETGRDQHGHAARPRDLGRDGHDRARSAADGRAAGQGADAVDGVVAGDQRLQRQRARPGGRQAAAGRQVEHDRGRDARRRGDLRQREHVVVGHREHGWRHPFAKRLPDRRPRRPRPPNRRLPTNCGRFPDPPRRVPGLVPARLCVAGDSACPPRVSRRTAGPHPRPLILLPHEQRRSICRQGGGGDRRQLGHRAGDRPGAGAGRRPGRAGEPRRGRPGSKWPRPPAARRTSSRPT